jgi:hypothetical protein
MAENDVVVLLSQTLACWILPDTRYISICESRNTTEVRELESIETLEMKETLYELHRTRFSHEIREKKFVNFDISGRSY